MKRERIIGIILIYISIILSLVNLSYADITGRVIGINGNGSILTVFIFVFFFIGLIFVSNLKDKIVRYGLVGLLFGGGGGYKLHNVAENNKKLEVASPSWTIEGKFERVWRWDDILDKVEKEYDIPRGTLKGLAIQESYGDPLKLNSSGDGGAGLFMMQPGIAQHYGLKTHGSSKRKSIDRKHGKELKELIKANNYDYRKMAKYDERFDVKKSAIAAAKLLTELQDRYHTWNEAISAYNLGQPAKHPLKTEHVKNTLEYKKYYNKRDHFWINQSKYKERHQPHTKNKKR